MAEEELREFDLIRWIRGQAASDERVRVGIGDDAAVVANRSDATLITTDMLVDGVHFDLREAPLGDINVMRIDFDSNAVTPRFHGREYSRSRPAKRI